MHRFVFSLVLVLLLRSPLAAEGQIKPFSALDIFNIQLATDPQISPDGKQIVYVRQFQDIMTDQPYSNLWIINADGSEHRSLTTGNFNDSTPRWSPDGKQLLYVSKRDGATQIYRRWLDSGKTACVTHGTSAPATPAWSPDGKWIAFTMHVPEIPPEIIKMPAAPEGAKWATPAKVLDQLVYRFNGDGYLKPGYTHLFVIPADGGTPRQISTGKFHHGGSAARGAGLPAWTPDGKYLILSANRHPNFEQEPLDTEVYEFAVSDGTVRALTNRKGPDDAAVVSPDGKSIATIGFDDRYQSYHVRKVYVMNRDGTGSRLLSGT